MYEMMNRWGRISRKVGVGAIVALLVAVQCYTVYLMVEYPQTGINVVRNESGDWVVRALYNKELTDRWNINIGDVIKQIDGTDPGQHDLVQLWEAVQQFREIIVDQDGISRVITIEEVPKLSIMDIEYIIGDLLSFGFAVYFYRKGGPRSIKLLMYLFLNLGIVYISLILSSRGDLVGKLVMGVSIMLAPLVLCNLFFVFFKEKSGIELPRKLLNLAYSLCFMAFVIDIARMLKVIGGGFLVSQRMTVGLFLLGIGYIFGILIYTHFKYKSAKSYYAPLLKSIWLALFVSFGPFIFLSFIPLLFVKEPLVNSHYTSWFLMLFPFPFAFLVATKQLYDVRNVLWRLTQMAVIALLPSLLAFSAVWLLFRETAEWWMLTIAFVAILVILTVALYALEYMTNILDPIMYPRKHQLQSSLKQLSGKLGSVTSFRELKDHILVDIVQTLQVRGGAIVFRYHDNVETIVAGRIDMAEVESLVATDAPEHPNYTTFEVSRHEEYTSYLIITRTLKGKRIGVEETQWLFLIISYLAISLENVHLIRKLTMRLEQLVAQLPNEQAASEMDWFRKLMFELQEKERIRIATDLHDTTMQDLFFLKRKLALLADKEELGGESREQLLSHMDYVDIINTNLRQSCFELHPHLLQESGLIPTLRKLVNEERAERPYEIRFSADRAQSVESCDLETKRHLFRIVQELFNNASKHSQASVLTLELMVVGGTLTLLYADDGVGFDSKAVSSMGRNMNGIGMEQLKTRVAHLKGWMEMEASAGNGLQLKITIPLKERVSA